MISSVTLFKIYGVKIMDDKLKMIRHSTAHLLAHAVSELFPGTLLTIGPATEEGFFYDFLPTQTFKEEDLNIIDARMRILAEKNIPIVQKEISKKEALEIYKNNPFKLELINDISGDTVGISQQGDFFDLCMGGHVPSTGHLKYFKLLSVAGSYWRANRENQSLQRIIGTAFETAEQLAEFEKRREEALKYDHRVIGKQLDLFSFQDVAPGMTFFHPRGKTIINVLTEYMRNKMEEHDYQEVATPTLLNCDVWKQSGHWNYYKDHMYISNIEETCYGLKPMSCPGAILIYKSKPRSYRELPLKFSEFGHVHRYELSGVLHSLLRVRAFTQDDAHIFCTEEQIEKEITKVLILRNKIFEKFNLKTRYVISTRPDKAMGSEEIWEKAINALKNSLEQNNLKYELAPKEGAFYGPKIDFVVEDVFRRTWTCGTIQVDFMLPENFEITYVASSGKQERPVMIHHAIYGSLERFFGIILEHYKGHLPMWLSPIQARILPVSEKQQEYAKNLYQELKKKNIRAEIDESGDALSGLIKRAQTDKVTCMIIIGQKELDNQTVTLRYLDSKQETISQEKFLNEQIIYWNEK